MEGVRDGLYTARYMAPKFWPVPNIVSGSPAPFAVTSGGEPVHLEAQIQPIPTRSGRVLDGTGKAVPNATVRLLWESKACKEPWCFPFTKQTKSGANGEYTFGDPEVPGTWLLSATAPSSWKPPAPRDGQALGWAQTFYPDVADAELAVRVVVQAGTELGNLDMKLAAAPVHRNRGVVLDAKGDPAAKAQVELAKGFGPAFEQETKEDGTFEFGPVADGEWRCSSVMEREGVRLWAAQAVRVKGDDLENVELRMTRPFSIHGTVVVEAAAGAPAPKMPTVMLAVDGSAEANGKSWIVTGVPDAKGEFASRNVYAGLYQVLPGPPPAGYYLDSIRAGGYEVRGSAVPLMADVATVSVIYKVGGGMVRGTVEECTGGMVVLVPRDLGLHAGPFLRTARCAQNGAFEFLAVRPGEYYGLAIGESGEAPWYEGLFDDGMLSQAGRVTVRANETTRAEIRIVRRR